MRWSGQLLMFKIVTFLFNFWGFYVYAQSYHLSWFGVNLSCCISLCIIIDYNNITCPIILGFSWLVNCIFGNLCWIIFRLKSHYVNHDNMLTFPANNNHKIVIKSFSKLYDTSNRYNNDNDKNGHILPTGQWYAPSVVINDACIACYCIVLYGIAWYCMVFAW